MPKVVEINLEPEELAEKLGEIMCTNVEVAAVMGCSADYVGDHFSDAIKRGRDKGKTRLRQKQFDVAMKGSYAMLIWLGKQYLGQTDKVEIDAGDVHAIFTLRGPGQAIDEPAGGNGEVKQIEGEVVSDDGQEEGDET